MNNSVNLPIKTNLSPLVFYIVAGEASGDILGARLMVELKQYFPNIIFKGIGGSLMIKEGLESFYPMDRLSVMGIAPILGRLPELLRMRTRLCKIIVREKADCFIGIDAPVFNTQLEYNLKKQHIKTVHYVSPSVWAWRENRIYKIVKSVSLMICLFPFELDIYKKHHLPAVCVGHPLADELPIESNRKQARERLGLNIDDLVLAILPGSRGSEMKFLLEPFLAAATLLKSDYPNLKVVIPCANTKRRVQLENFVKEKNIALDMRIIDGESRTVMASADAVLLASGTATLEAMLLKKPMVVGYKVSSFSYWVYSKLLKIGSFSLPNLLAKKNLVKELMQDECTERNLYRELLLLIGKQDNESLQSEYVQLHHALQLGGSQKAAKAIASLINCEDS